MPIEVADVNVRDDQIVIADLNSFDLKLKTNAKRSVYEGDICLGDNCMLFSMVLEDKFISSSDINYFKHEGSKIVEFSHKESGAIYYIHSIDEGKNFFNLSCSLGVDTKKFTVSLSKEVYNTIDMNNILSFSSRESIYSPEEKICGPCVGVVVAAIGAVACAVATVNANEDCVEEFGSSCGDGGASCCSMSFSSNGCGGSCNITCN